MLGASSCISLFPTFCVFLLLRGLEFVNFPQSLRTLTFGDEPLSHIKGWHWCDFLYLSPIHTLYIYVYIHQPVIWVSEKITLLVVGLSRIARGEVVSFCVPAVFWWFFSYSAVVHVSFVLLCAVLCCFRTFICILCALVISLCAAVFWWLFGSSSCIIFAMHRAMTILLHWHWQRIYLSD